MVFHKKKQKKSIDYTVIDRVQSFNFLSIMLNEDLSWKNHIAMISDKISKVLGILYRLSMYSPKVCYLRFTIFLRFVN